MKQLLQGMESREKVDCLLAQTKIESGPKVDAIYCHLVQGAGQSRAAIMHSVKQSKLSEVLTTLNEVAEHNERYHELKVYKPDTDEQRDTRVRAVLTEWQRGCSDTLGGEPSDCIECTDGAVSAINRLFGEAA